MKLSIVLRSVAILLAAPLLALPGGVDHQAEGGDAPAPEPAKPSFLRVEPAQAHAATARRAPDARQARAVATPASRPPGKPANELDVTVSCAHDGCVVQNGLDVLVVGP